MKKTAILTTLIAGLASTAFAEATITITSNANVKDSVEGYDVVAVADGTNYATAKQLVTQLGSNEATWIRLAGQLNFDDDTNLTLTANSSKLGTSGYYSFMGLDSTNPAVLNFTGTGVLNASKAGLNSYNSNLTITVEKGAGGLITPKICAQNKSITLNNHEAYGIRSSNANKAFSFCLVTTANINMTADMAITTDFRNNTNLNLNISNNANLFIESGINILNDGYKANIKIADDSLTSGAILFDKDIVSSEYDADGKIVITTSEKKETLSIMTSSGDALTGLYWQEVTINGNDYYRLSGTALTIPEPAEWAAIFGGLALALAIYRRRK